MQRYKSTGLSLPYKLLKDIDSERGDISRSRFLLRLILKAYEERQRGATKESASNEGSFSDLLSAPLDDLSERNGADSSSRLRGNKSESGHKIRKSKQGSLDIRFPPLQSSESGIPQQ